MGSARWPLAALGFVGLRDIRGKKATTQFTHMILGQHLKFYAGILRNPWTQVDVKGLHEPMITPDEMEQIKAVRSGRSFVVKRSKFNPEFCLKSTVLCAECSRHLTGSHPQGNGGNYAYYHCYNRECVIYGKSIDKAKLEKVFSEKLEEVRPRQDFFDSFNAVVLDYWNSQGVRLEDAAKSYQAQLADLEAKKKRVYEMREDGSYSKEEFLERKQGIETEMAAARIAMNDSKMDDFDMAGVLEFTQGFLANVSGDWATMPPEVRPQFQKLVLPDGISYDRKNGFGTMKLGLIYETNQHFHADEFRMVDLTAHY